MPALDSPRPWPGLRTETPARYRICVQGRLDPSRSDQLGGMEVDITKAADDTFVSKLQGRLVDQAALTGILNTLYNMQLPVLSVECLEAYEQ